MQAPCVPGWSDRWVERAAVRADAPPSLGPAVSPEARRRVADRGGRLDLRLAVTVFLSLRLTACYWIVATSLSAASALRQERQPPASCGSGGKARALAAESRTEP